MDQHRRKRPITVQKTRKGMTRQTTVSGRPTDGGIQHDRNKLPGQNPQARQKSSPVLLIVIGGTFLFMVVSVTGLLLYKFTRSNADSTSPVLASFSGQVVVKDQSDGSRPTAKDYRLVPGDKVELGKGGEAKLVFDDGTAFKLSSEAKMQLAGPWSIVLNAGSISVASGKIPNGKVVIVETPHGRANANSGASFIVKTDKTGTRLNVMKGSVNMQDKIRMRAKVFAAGSNPTAFIPIETVVKEKKAKRKK